ncbi:DeoR/GlpR family DNA-binding transcription regulator [Aeromicrobium alkaliterrae]|uniref:Lactose phosphotransferase system repressor n=1 Tax=Aeromicrobium alkaliterrae TaxID=302168 RepID=A0ABN2JWH0_9ACTN
MYASERRTALAHKLRVDGRVSVVDAATEFGVSGETVRRDLAALERHGVARRVHGGAVARTSVQAVELGLVEREGRQAEQKTAIAVAALAFLPEVGGSIIVDAGTSTAALVEQLPHDLPLVAITHGVVTAAQLARSSSVDLNVLGGRVRDATGAAVGPGTVAAYGQVGVDVAFIGANGVSPERGLTTADFAEAAVKSAIVASARQTVVLADATKLDTDFVVTFAALDDVDVLVTDTSASPEAIARIREAGVEVVLA